MEDAYTEDGFTTSIIPAQYSETEMMPKNEVITPFELIFDVSTTATPGMVQIEVTEESCLIGNDTYFFEERIAGELEITAKLAESIEIDGVERCGRLCSRMPCGRAHIYRINNKKGQTVNITLKVLII